MNISQVQLVGPLGDCGPAVGDWRPRGSSQRGTGTSGNNVIHKYGILVQYNTVDSLIQTVQ